MGNIIVNALCTDPINNVSGGSHILKAYGGFAWPTREKPTDTPKPDATTKVYLDVYVEID